MRNKIYDMERGIRIRTVWDNTDKPEKNLKNTGISIIHSTVQAPKFKLKIVIVSHSSNSMTYGTRRFNVAYTRVFQ